MSYDGGSAAAAIGERPLCKYGAFCARKNPQHFFDFAHPDSPPLAARRREAESGDFTPVARPAAPMSFRPAVRGEAGRRCKFGCARPVSRDELRVYDTCCRACGVCQGGGDHDASCVGGAATSVASEASMLVTAAAGHVEQAFKDAEAQAIMTVDLALELRRRAKSLEAGGFVDRARVLQADSVEQMHRARAMMHPGSKLLALLDSVLSMWSRADGPDPFSPRMTSSMAGEALEEEVDTELERLVTELETTLEEIVRPSPGVTPDAALQAYTQLVPAVETFLAPPGAALPMAPDAQGAYDTSRATGRLPGEADQGTPSSPSRGGLGSHPAQFALRSLGLDDAWPTELTRGEIRRRYMREALRSHPDKGPAEEKSWRTSKFQAMSDAYSTMEVYIAVLERMRGGDIGSMFSGASATAATSAPVASSVRWGEREQHLLTAELAGQPHLALAGQPLSIEAGQMMFGAGPTS